MWLSRLGCGWVVVIRDLQPTMHMLYARKRDNRFQQNICLNRGFKRSIIKNCKFMTLMIFEFANLYRFGNICN
jgi:hypothetical protein